MNKKRILIGLGGVVVLFLLIQIIPFGREHANPPVVKEPNWDSLITRSLAKRACFDCHSNETVWPWYSNIAPVSWLVQYDVNEGRDVLNFSDWGNLIHSEHYTHIMTDAFTEVLLENTMPPDQYLLLHPEAELNLVERDQLLIGLRQTIANSK